MAYLQGKHHSRPTVELPLLGQNVLRYECAAILRFLECKDLFDFHLSLYINQPIDYSVRIIMKQDKKNS